MTDTRTPDDDNGSKLSSFLMTVGGLSLLIALGIVHLQVGLLVKDQKWTPPIAHFLVISDVYPTQGLIGAQKIVLVYRPVNERADNARLRQ